MNVFSPEWLKLREGADKRARNPDVASALSAWLALREHVSVIDLGSGTGSNLRATAPLLPSSQSWRLIDNDAGLLDAAKSALKTWADKAEETPQSSDDVLTLVKGHAHITVKFEIHNLAGDINAILGEGVDLVTASALFDLTSAEFIRSLAHAVAARRAAFYAVLTYNGLQKWAPHRPADNQIASAFNRHQMTDKGFGPAAGPLAPSELADQFRLEGYSVLEGNSPWRLGQGDRTLIEELQRGHALAVLETKAVDTKTVESWVKVIRGGAEIGHTDIFAVPGG